MASTGKHLPTKSSPMRLDGNHRPGCMSILHILRYNHHWRYVKKRLPSRRHKGGRNSDDEGSSGSHSCDHHTGRFPEFANPEGDSLHGDRKKRESSKHSMKARIKALMSEEKSRKKGQHRRSSTSPSYLEVTEADSNHHQDSSDEESPATQNGRSPPYLQNEYDEVDKYGEQSTRNGRPSQEKSVNSEQDLLEKGLMYERKHAADGLKLQTPNVLDPLDMVDLDKKLVLKYLQDTESFSARHIGEQKAVNAKRRLRRSGTFPVPGSSGEKDSSPNMSENKEEEEERANKEAEEECGDSKLPSLDQDIHLNPIETDASRPAPILLVKKHGNYQVVSKHFKSLRKKIKHVIKANRKEKQRIAMDGMIDKIPCDHEHSMELKQEVLRKWKDVVLKRDQNSNLSQGKDQNTQPRAVKRTPSFDKYCQLLESSFSKDGKDCETGISGVRGQEPNSSRETTKRSLGRIHSLPELKCYSFSSEHASIVGALNPDWKVADIRISRGSSFNEENDQKFDIISDSHLELDAQEDNQVDEGKPDDGEAVTSETSSNSGQFHHGKDASIDEEVIELSTLDAEFNQGSLLDEVELDSQAIRDHETGRNEPFEPDDGVNLKSAGNILSDMEFLKVHVDVEDIELFNYVKDVLELSGINTHESLETWQNIGQLMDESDYGEAEGCLLRNLDHLENKEGGNCNHLVVLHLINEVATDIYQRSFGYYARPLSSLCHVHPMPIGYRVLEEVWAILSCYTRVRPELDSTMDYVIARDLEKHSGWMNLRFDSECVAMELEGSILDDLLDELVMDDLLDELYWT